MKRGKKISVHICTSMFFSKDILFTEMLQKVSALAPKLGYKLKFCLVISEYSIYLPLVQPRSMMLPLMFPIRDLL